MSIDVRAMTHDDVDHVDEVWRAAFVPTMTDRSTPTVPRTERERHSDLARFHHLISTDPLGAFVATERGKIVGMCQSLRRGQMFLLSRLGVAPEYQDLKIGRALLDAALTYADDSDQQFIFTSRDPRAIHSYLREGFVLHPCIQLTGRARDIEPPESMRAGGPRDIDFIDSIDRTQRGLSRSCDLQLWFDLGANAFIDEAGGYLIFDGTRILSLCATSTSIAQGLLSFALGGAFDKSPLDARWIVEEQRWAIDGAIESRASIAIGGAVLTRNVERFAVPYLPNASFG